MHNIKKSASVKKWLKADIPKISLKLFYCEFLQDNIFYIFPCQLGLQEYVEAVSFQYFIKTRSLISLEDINKQLIFTEDNKEEERKVLSFLNVYYKELI